MDDEYKKQSKDDHDLLVRVDEKLNGLGMHVREISTNLTARVTALEVSKIDKSEVEKLLQTSITDRRDLRRDVDSLKMWRWLTTGGLIIISMLVMPMAIYIFKLNTDVQKNVQSSVQSGLLDALQSYNLQK